MEGRSGARVSAVLALAVLLSISGCTSVLGGPAAVESSFDDGPEGWTVSGDAQGGSVEPTYHEGGGADGGWLSSTDDVQGGVWYWSAPDAYLGDKAAFYGGALSFQINQTPNTNQFDAVDLIVESGDTRLGYRFGDADDYPGVEWTRYDISLTEDGWTNLDTGESATREEFEAVLGDLDGLFIRGEYRTGSDVGGLDDVRMAPG